MNESKYITTRAAQALAIASGLENTSQDTIRTWAVKYRFGKKIGGRFRIGKNDFDKFLKGGNKWQQEGSKEQEPTNRPVPVDNQKKTPTRVWET